VPKLYFPPLLAHFEWRMMKQFLLLLAALAVAPADLGAGTPDHAPLPVSLLENDVLRLRVEHLTGNLAEEIRAAQSTNRLAGVILDLRSADGGPNAALAATGLFPAQKVPLVILVNGQTRGAAVALAAQLRDAGPAVVIGSTNTTTAFRPDIAVAVSAEDEQRFLLNPYFTPPVSPVFAATNDLLPFVDHMSEAELVRKKMKDGEGADEDALAARAAVPPVIRDPALARAVDLFKALAVLHPAHG
jgi:hypothetical protein